MTSLKRSLEPFNVLEETIPGVHQEVKRFKNATEEDLFNSLEYVPQTQKGLVVSSFTEDLKLLTDLPVPQKLQPHEILIKNKYIGLNHVDWKSKKYRFSIYSFPWVNGRESSGIVVKRGERVDEDRFPLGCEVFIASTTYRDLRTSTFQEYTVFDSRLVWRVPERIGLDFASGIGVSLVTAGAALASKRNVKDEPEAKRSLVIWGGSTGVGIFVVQLAKSLGFTQIIAITSKKHESYLVSLGATHIIHRENSHDEIAEKIKKICPNGVAHGVDLISKKTATVLSNILLPESQLVCAAGCPDRDQVRDKTVKLDAINLKAFHEDLEYGQEFVKYTSELFEKNRLKPLSNLKLFKGLDNFCQGIRNGLRELEERGASAEKYVVAM
ncbi:unnamed protein product [Kluyveromyces dobzhanskii CBS 2104]|uniref:WGS project CCBQ000000000 data, contig 00272 n=1 Tax=Kluyveromyces dobzhanskii CBS 2104 TaxID=1427455 RepID=A0A0A8L8N2_9SACH|nr:unnamed protein product [Kluyveromyces dobzhanskii CBS 2104]